MADFKEFVKSTAKNFVDRGLNNLLSDVFGTAGPENGFNVNNLTTSLNKQGIAKTSDFEVWITSGKPEEERELRVRAESVDIPGRNFIVADHKFTNIGPVNRIPTMQTYTDVTVSFILSEDMREKEYFEQWQEKIMNTGVYEQSAEQYNMGLMQADNGDLDFTQFSGNENYTNTQFMYKYFDTYIGTVDIRQYGAGGRLASIHTLQEAYPISIAPISMSWGEENVARLQVTFAYKNYKAVFNRASQPGLGAGFYFNIGKGGTNFGFKLPGQGGSVSYSKEVGYVGNFDTITKKMFRAAAGGVQNQQAMVTAGQPIPLNEYGSPFGGSATPPNNEILDTNKRTDINGN